MFEDIRRANMNWQVSYLYILWAILCVFYVNSNPNPLPPESPSSVSGSIRSSNATNEVILHCFSPEIYPERLPLNATDCPKAMLELVLSPNFNTPHKFSKNTRRFDTHRLPMGWWHGNCIIMLSSSNDWDTAVFRLADVANRARSIINVCINGQAVTYGGIVGMLSDVPSFYVSVGAPAESGNIDTLDSLEEYSTAIYETELGSNTMVSETE